MAAKTKFILEADEAKAVSAFLKVVEAQNKTAAGMKKVAREGKKAGQGVSDSLRGAGGAADRMGGKIGGVGKKFGGVSGAAKKMFSNLTGLVTGFVGFGAIVKGLREIVQEMNAVAVLRKEMLDTAVTLEELSLKIANLPGRQDVSGKGLQEVTNKIAEVAKKTHTTMDVAASALFFSESEMGAKTPAAESAAINILKFAGPAGLKAEEVTQLPKIFYMLGADTKEKQLAVLNQIWKAFGESIAETGEALTGYITTVAQDVEKGFKFSESLARMVALIETSPSPSEAGMAARAGMEIATGRTAQALEFFSEQYLKKQMKLTPIEFDLNELSKPAQKEFAKQLKEQAIDLSELGGKDRDEILRQAREKDIDYGKLSNVERFKFTRELYEESARLVKEGYKGENPMDIFKTMVGAKGFRYLVQTFGETGKRKYEAVLPKIETAATADYVQEQARKFETTRIAQQRDRKTTATMAEGLTGRQKQALTILEQETENIRKQARALGKGWGDYAYFAFRTKGRERHNIARMFMMENLVLAFEKTKEGTEERAKVEKLIKDFHQAGSLGLPAFAYGAHPDIIHRVFEATEEFGLIDKEGRLADKETIGLLLTQTTPEMLEKTLGTYNPAKWPEPYWRQRREVLSRGLKQYYQIPETGKIAPPEAGSLPPDFLFSTEVPAQRQGPFAVVDVNSENSQQAMREQNRTLEEQNQLLKEQNGILKQTLPAIRDNTQRQPGFNIDLDHGDLD